MRPRLLAPGCAAVLALVAGCGSTSTTSSTHTTSSTDTTRTSVVTSLATSTAAVAVTATHSAESATTGTAVMARFFSPLSPWNTTVRNLPVDARSAKLLALAADRDEVVQLPHSQTIAIRVRTVQAGLYINTSGWTTPIVTDQGGVWTKVFCRQLDCGPSSVGVKRLLIPPNVSPDPRFDGWFSVIDRRDGVGYDLWRARRQADGSISYQFIKRWNLDGPGYSQPIGVDPADATGAHGSGLPLFAGVILPEELRSGVIDHALAISVPGPAATNFVAPASATDGVGAPNSLPEGARIRLRRGVRLGPLPRGANRRTANAILTALRVYGAIVVDRARVPTLYAQAGVSPALLEGGELGSLHLRDFQVLALPTEMADPGQSGAVAGTGVK
jgi:hypothetical protein